MADLSTLRDLQRRLREATGPDRELEHAMFAAFDMPTEWFGSKIISHFRCGDGYGFNTADGYRHLDCLLPGPYTSSLDAIRAAVRRAFPNACITINEWTDHADFGFSLKRHEWDLATGDGEAPTTPLAACLALVSALIAIEEGKGESNG